jgi:hypothetical protein
MSYKALFALAAIHDLEIQQMDIKTAFLNGDLNEEVYVLPPDGFEAPSGKVCRLNKSLYGLKQAPRAWYDRLSTFLKTLGFERTAEDYSIFIYPTHRTIIAVYVDDLLIVGADKAHIQQTKADLSKEFQMEDLGDAAYYLGLEIRRDRAKRKITLGQQAYIRKILNDFFPGKQLQDKQAPMAADRVMEPRSPDLTPANPDFKTKYQSAVGALMYLMLGTRPDLAYAVS